MLHILDVNAFHHWEGHTPEDTYRSPCHTCHLPTIVDIPVDRHRLSWYRAQKPDTVHRYWYSSHRMYRQGSL